MPAEAQEQLLPSLFTPRVYPPPAIPLATAASSSYTTWRFNDRQERRQCPRRDLRCRILLIDDLMGLSENPASIPGQCLNVCDAGLYATVLPDCGITIGQRYTFRLMVGERGPEPGAVQIVSQQGLIIRAELLAGSRDDDHRLGIGVRLTGRRSGVIPMPNWQ